MSVWLTIPSKRPPDESEKILSLWRERGYRVALAVDASDYQRYVPRLEMAHHWWAVPSPYPGYAHSVNTLVRRLLESEAGAEWFVVAGDDVEPDVNRSAEELARECREHFGGTFGVMQPTGDRWGDRHDGKGAYIDRVCGSAWIGRDFAQRVNCGRGPLWGEYFHMFVDEELQCVARELLVLWQRRDLTQIHRHWGRGPDDNSNRIQDGATRMPAFLAKANSGFAEARALFERRKSARFPGSELMA